MRRPISHGTLSVAMITDQAQNVGTQPQHSEKSMTSDLMLWQMFIVPRDAEHDYACYHTEVSSCLVDTKDI